MTARLGVVIVNFNTREATLACLRTLLPELEPDDRVVLVDNGSHDGSAEAIRAELPAVEVVDGGGNLGFARAVNVGVGHLETELVLLLNPDTEVRPGSLAALRRFAHEHPEYRMYGGRTIRRDGALEPSSCWGEMTLWSLVCFATGLSTLARSHPLFDPESLGRWGRDSLREVPIITGCLLLVSRADFLALRGMDETYFLYGEDADFSVRARRAGLRPVVVPDAVIIHDVGGSSVSSRKSAMVLAGKATLLRTLWSPLRGRMGIGLLVVGVAVRAAGERLRRRDGAWHGAWVARRVWVRGYPSAREPLFGPVPAEVAG